MNEMKQLVVNKVSAKLHRLPLPFADKDAHNWNYPPANSYPFTLESLNAPLRESYSWQDQCPMGPQPASSSSCENATFVLPCRLALCHLAEPQHAILKVCSKRQKSFQLLFDSYSTTLRSKHTNHISSNCISSLEGASTASEKPRVLQAGNESFL